VDHRDLVVFQRARALADEVRACVGLWTVLDQRTAGDQAVRAADSVPANIAEGLGRHGNKDQKRFLYFARASVLELATWLDTAERRGNEAARDGGDRAREIARMLNGLIRRRKTPYDL
jgi:four helix bundle protein